MERRLNKGKKNNDEKLFDSMFFSEDSESEIGKALRIGDDNFIQNYAKQFEGKKENELFDILDRITIKRDRNFDVRNVKYNKFIIEEMLSRSTDCLHVVMTLNLIGEGLTNQQHYDYLIRNVPVGRKSYRDGTKEYMRDDAKEALVKILLMDYYDCNFRLAHDYYEVLIARKLVGQFVWENRGYLLTQSAQSMVSKYIKHKDQLREYNSLVDELTGGKFDRDHVKDW